MDKNEVLCLLQNLILQLRDESSLLQSDSNLKKDWVVKHQVLQRELKNLNSCDSLWLNEEYGKFFRKEIAPSIAKLDPNLLRSLQ